MTRERTESGYRTEANSALGPVSRRETLTRTATATALGVVGAAGVSGTAAAGHGCGWEEDQGAQVSEQGDASGELTLTTDTDLCWHSWDSTERRHYFRMVTCSQTEFPDEDSVLAIREHRVTVDCCTDELIPDISENETGTVPPDETNVVDTDFADVAKVAIDAVAGLTVFGSVVTALDGIKETADILGGESNCSGFTSEYSVDRVFDSSLRREAGVTTQCEFAVELPSGTSDGLFFLESYTHAEDARYSAIDTANCEIEDQFQVYVDDSGNADLRWHTSDYDTWVV